MSRGIEQEIIELDRERGQALVRGDAEYIERVYADELTYINPWGYMVHKPEYVETVKAGNLQYESLPYEDVKVRIYGDVAILTELETLKGKGLGGYVVSGQYLYTRVYVRRRDGSWQLVAQHGTHKAPQQQGAD